MNTASRSAGDSGGSLKSLCATCKCAVVAVLVTASTAPLGTANELPSRPRTQPAITPQDLPLAALADPQVRARAREQLEQLRLLPVALAKGYESVALFELAEALPRHRCGLADDKHGHLSVELWERRTFADEQLRGIIPHLRKLKAPIFPRARDWDGHLDLRDTALTHESLGDLKTVPLLRAITLTRMTIGDHAVTALKGWETLAFLGLAETKVTDSSLAAMRELPGLEGLDLWGTRVTALGIMGLKGHTKLRRINLEPRRFSADELVAISVALPDVKLSFNEPERP